MHDEKRVRWVQQYGSCHILDIINMTTYCSIVRNHTHIYHSRFLSNDPGHGVWNKIWKMCRRWKLPSPNSHRKYSKIVNCVRVFSNGANCCECIWSEPNHECLCVSLTSKCDFYYWWSSHSVTEIPRSPLSLSSSFPFSRSSLLQGYFIAPAVNLYVFICTGINRKNVLYVYNLTNPTNFELLLII